MLASEGFPDLVLIPVVFVVIALVAWALVTIAMVAVFAGVATFVRRWLLRGQDVEPWDSDSN